MLGFYALGEVPLGTLPIVVTPVVVSTVDMHDGPPPAYFAWASEQRRAALKAAKTKREAVTAVVEAAEEALPGAPADVQVEARPVLRALREPVPDFALLMQHLALLEQLLLRYDQFKHEQEIILLLMED